jgi:hypothetical protein
LIIGRFFDRNQGDYFKGPENQGSNKQAASHVPHRDARLQRISIGHHRCKEEADARQRDDQRGNQPVQHHRQRMKATPETPSFSFTSDHGLQAKLCRSSVRLLQCGDRSTADSRQLE